MRAGERVGQNLSKLRKLVAARKWRLIGDITASGALELLGQLRRDGLTERRQSDRCRRRRRAAKISVLSLKKSRSRERSRCGILGVRRQPDTLVNERSNGPSDSLRLEVRRRQPKAGNGSPCAAPWALVRGKPGAKLGLEVRFDYGRRHLPVVALRRVA